MLGSAEVTNAQVINMNPRFLYFKDESLDWVVSLNLDRIKRVADRRDVLREAVRCLKPGGVVLLLAGGRCDEYAQTLLKLGMSDVTRIHPLRYIRRGRFVAARKGGTARLEDRIALAGIRRFTAGRDEEGRTAWTLSPD